jgi:hypothetical protein
MTIDWEEPPLFDPPAPTHPAPTPIDETIIVFTHWVTTLRNTGRGVKPVLSDERRRKIRKALDMYGLDTCLAAIDGCAKSAFHMGANARTKRYDDISLILRDAKHIEMFADLADELTAEEAFKDTPRPKTN